jgi:transcriptional regulator with XRE-family HTH domain
MVSPRSGRSDSRRSRQSVDHTDCRMDGPVTEHVEFFLKGRPKLAKPYHLKGVGLPYVYLLNGVTLEDDPEYGELITIENVQGLYRAIGLHIIGKEAPMTGDEFRFLRKEMEFTQVQLADRLLVDQQTVANYEKGKTAHGAADAALRLDYLMHITPPKLLGPLVKAIREALPRAQMPETSRRQIVGKWQERPEPIAA